MVSIIIGPYFFDQTVNSDWYCNMLTDYFIPNTTGHDCIDNWWFMQDGARSHRTEQVFDILEEQFDHRLIALDYRLPGRITWPPFSSDLNIRDFFLWGCLKDRIYKKPVASLIDLKGRIESEIQNINSSGVLPSVVNNFKSRLSNCHSKKV